jgi:hypothetical protein
MGGSRWNFRPKKNEKNVFYLKCFFCSFYPFLSFLKHFWDILLTCDVHPFFILAPSITKEKFFPPTFHTVSFPHSHVSLL